MNNLFSHVSVKYVFIQTLPTTRMDYKALNRLHMFTNDEINPFYTCTLYVHQTFFHKSSWDYMQIINQQTKSKHFHDVLRTGTYHKFIICLYKQLYVTDNSVTRRKRALPRQNWTRAWITGSWNKHKLTFLLEAWKFWDEADERVERFCSEHNQPLLSSHENNNWKKTTFSRLSWLLVSFHLVH